MTVGVVDYGAGNMYSILCGLQRLDIESEVVTNLRDLREFTAVVIPGVGNFSHASAALYDYKETLQDIVEEGRIVLGICLGMQMLLDDSEEGVGAGLGLIPGSVKLLPSDVKVPHMGWNTVDVIVDCELFENVPEQSYFYFVHSYYTSIQNSSDVIATTEYSVEFPSVIGRGSVYGLQFHPEKSGDLGAIVLENFKNMLVR